MHKHFHAYKSLHALLSTALMALAATALAQSPRTEPSQPSPPEPIGPSHGAIVDKTPEGVDGGRVSPTRSSSRTETVSPADQERRTTRGNSKRKRAADAKDSNQGSRPELGRAPDPSSHERGKSPVRQESGEGTPGQP